MAYNPTSPRHGSCSDKGLRRAAALYSVGSWWLLMIFIGRAVSVSDPSHCRRNIRWISSNNAHSPTTDCSDTSKTQSTASSDFAATPAWSLETLTLAAFYYSPELAVVWANYETVAAGKQTAAQRPNPAVSISPAYNTVNAVPSPWLVTATLDVPIETAGKRAHRIAAARSLPRQRGLPFCRRRGMSAPSCAAL